MTTSRDCRTAERFKSLNTEPKHGAVLGYMPLVYSLVLVEMMGQESRK